MKTLNVCDHFTLRLTVDTFTPNVNDSILFIGYKRAIAASTAKFLLPTSDCALKKALRDMNPKLFNETTLFGHPSLLPSLSALMRQKNEGSSWARGAICSPHLLLYLPIKVEQPSPAERLVMTAGTRNLQHPRRGTSSLTGHAGNARHVQMRATNSRRSVRRDDWMALRTARTWDVSKKRLPITAERPCGFTGNSPVCRSGCRCAAGRGWTACLSVRDFLPRWRSPSHTEPPSGLSSQSSPESTGRQAEKPSFRYFSTHLFGLLQT